MTYKEARKDIIESGIELGGGDYVELEALRVAVEALDKQIPKKMETRAHKFFIQGYLEEEVYYCCPTCGMNHGNRDELRRQGRRRHCHKCGQALQWPKEARQ